MRDSGRKKVLILAETGFIIRNLLLGYFAESLYKTHDLVIAVQNPDDDLLKEIIRDKPITLISFPRESYIDEGPLWRKFFSRNNWMYCLRLARKNNKSLEIQTKLFEGTLNWKKWFAFKLPVFVAYGLNATGSYAVLEDTYLAKYILRKEVTHQWLQILEQIKPDLVFSSMLTHSVRLRSSSDLPVVVAARHLNIKTCTLVQSWDNLSSKVSVLPYWVDRYFTWSQSMRDELLSLCPRISENKVIITGSPQYDFHLDRPLLIPRDQYLTELGLDVSKPYIVIGTGTARWMPDEMEKVIVLSGKVLHRLPNVQVLIRLHPKDHGERWEPYLKKLAHLGIYLQKTSPEEHMDRGGFVPPRDFYKDQINTIYHSALVINSSSSLTVDAAIFDKPVICIAYDLRPDPVFPEGRSLAYSQSIHYAKLVNTGGVWVVRSEEECIKAVQTYMSNPELHQRERRDIVNLVADKVQEKAGTRLANEVARLLENKTVLNMGSRLTTQNYWINYYTDANEDTELNQRLGSNYDALWQKLLRSVSQTPQTVLEIGAFPGRYLAYLSKKYNLHPTGIDFNPETDKVDRVMKSMGVEHFSYIAQDFFSVVPEQKFDLVVSLGFIEHFENFNEVMDKHCKFLKPGGSLLIMVPNKRYLRYLFGILLDYENLKIHNLKCMNMDVFKGFAKRNNLEIKELSYFGGFSCKLHGKINILQRLIYKPWYHIARKLNPSLAKHPSKWWSGSLVGIFHKPL